MPARPDRLLYSAGLEAWIAPWHLVTFTGRRPGPLQRICWCPALRPHLLDRTKGWAPDSENLWSPALRPPGAGGRHLPLLSSVSSCLDTAIDTEIAIDTAAAWCALITATATTTSRTSLYKSFIECNVRDVAVADSWPPRQRTQRHHGTGHNVVSRPFLAWRSTMSVERHSRTLLGMLCAVSTGARPMVGLLERHIVPAPPRHGPSSCQHVFIDNLCFAGQFWNPTWQ